MLLFVGLGNPGPQYARNRHNVGFMAVQAIARRHEMKHWGVKFHGMVSGGPFGTESVLLLLPTTFMNDSGRAVAEAVRFYKIMRHQIIVFHDELDLPPSKVRVKIGGSDAGHNGLRSITAHIGSDYKRLRIGIGHPGSKHLVERYVLQDFSIHERSWVEPLCEIIADNFALLVEGKDSTFQNKVHLAMSAKGFGGADEGDTE